MMNNNKPVKLSMVIPTLGRIDEVDKLLTSIYQFVKNITLEIIIVDQNEKPVLDEIVRSYKTKLPIRHEKVNFRGASRARNYGLKLACGKYICYPDDDCKFCEGTVEKALYLLDQNLYDCVCGRSFDDANGNDSMFNYPKKDKILTTKNMENSFVEFSVIFKRDIALKYLYDEEMGVGCLHGAQEGYDVIYRMLLDDCRMYYTPEIVFNHPEKKCGTTSPSDMRRAFYYSCGLGYLCLKHNLHYKYRKRLIMLVCAMPYFYIFKHRSYKYYSVQILGLKLGHDYL